jgi:hypothetical protein
VTEERTDVGSAEAELTWVGRTVRAGLRGSLRRIQELEAQSVSLVRCRLTQGRSARGQTHDGCAPKPGEVIADARHAGAVVRAGLPWTLKSLAKGVLSPVRRRPRESADNPNRSITTTDRFRYSFGCVLLWASSSMGLRSPDFPSRSTGGPASAGTTWRRYHPCWSYG